METSTLDRLLGPAERHAGRLRFENRLLVSVDLMRTGPGSEYTARGPFPADLPPQGSTAVTIYGPAGSVEIRAQYVRTAPELLHLTCTGRPTVTQLRKHFRYQLALPCVVRGKGLALHGYTQDISLTGCLLALASGLRSGTAYEITFGPAQGSLALPLTVLRTRQADNSHLVHCTFPPLPLDRQKQILRMIMAEMTRHDQGNPPSRSPLATRV